jgi:PAS domain S-box-containing protein
MKSVNKDSLGTVDNTAENPMKDKISVKMKADQLYPRKQTVLLKYIVAILLVEMGILLLAFLFYHLKVVSSEFLIDDQEAFAVLFALSTFIIVSFIVVSFRRIQELKWQVKNDQQVMETLFALQSDSENRVNERTSDLIKLNEKLLKEVIDHQASLDALASSEKKYRDLFDKSIQPMFQSSVSGKLIAANPAFLKLLGFSSLNEFQDVELASLYANPGDREVFTETMNVKGYCHLELQVKRKDGKRIHVLEHARTIYDESNVPLMYEGVLEDITFMKAMESKLNEYTLALKSREDVLTKLNAKKNKTMSILSHDLRAPFSSILGFCEILLDEHETLDPQERREFTSYIKESSEQLLKLVNDLLDWTRIESGKTGLDISSVDLSNVIQKSVRTNFGLATQKNIALMSSVPKGLIIRGDDQKLSQVFNNLISNSLKFTPAGGEIVLNASSDAVSGYTITIRDTGIGIPENDLPKLMKVEEKYTRLGLGGEKGTGLGLVLCREIMKKHGGDIRIESMNGKGTAIYLDFPVPAKRETTKETILIVDNEKGVRALHASYVKRFKPDIHLVEAGDGIGALHLALEYLPSMIISEYVMPQMDGLELIKSLRQDRRTRPIPILIITNHATEGIIEILKDAGAVDVVMKPLNAESFEINVLKWMKPELSLDHNII